MKFYLWNMFACIINGQKVKRSFIEYPSKKFCIPFLNILWDEGFILGYKISNNNKNNLKIFLNYKNKRPVIKVLKCITRPGSRKYFSINQLWKIKPQGGVLIVSTNKGLLMLDECKKLNIGGEPFLILK